MLRIIQLEFLKLKHYKPFWIIMGLFTLCFFLLGIFVKKVIDWILAEGAFDENLDIFKKVGIPIFDFVDIWQNMGYLTFAFKWVLAFVVIISVCMEFGNKTIRQNIIDGLSRHEYLLSKIGVITALSLFAGVLLFLLCIFLGLMYSQVKSLDFIFLNIEFVPAYMLEVFAFLSLAMFFAFLIKRTGFAIILFIFYTAVIEPIAEKVMYFQYDLPTWYLPVKSINNLIRLPFQKYGFYEVQDYVALQDVLVCSVWTIIFLVGSYLLLRKKNI